MKGWKYVLHALLVYAISLLINTWGFWLVISCFIEVLNKYGWDIPTVSGPHVLLLTACWTYLRIGKNKTEEAESVEVFWGKVFGNWTTRICTCLLIAILALIIL